MWRTRRSARGSWNATRLVNQVEGRPNEQIFAHPDDLKFPSSMTLFAHATPDNQVFFDALQKYFKGQFDSSTLARLQIQ